MQQGLVTVTRPCSTMATLRHWRSRAFSSFSAQILLIDDEISPIEPTQRSNAGPGARTVSSIGAIQSVTWDARAVKQPGLRLAQQHQDHRKRDAQSPAEAGHCPAGDLPGRWPCDAAPAPPRLKTRWTERDACPWCFPAPGPCPAPRRTRDRRRWRPAGRSPRAAPDPDWPTASRRRSARCPYRRYRRPVPAAWLPAPPSPLRRSRPPARPGLRRYGAG